MGAKLQPQLMGVYRLVDSYNDRPVFKQDMGENYIYYSSGSSSWLVGCRVGHRYSWLRNTSNAAAGARWPQLLRSGWRSGQLLVTRPHGMRIISLWRILEMWIRSERSSET